MKKYIYILIILIIAGALRFYNLGQNPPSLYWDEVALGYNAYALAQTGKDEEGVFFPIQYVRSFGDFKPPVYMYAAVPMIKLLGLNEWTTRFPSAFFGTLSVLLAYLITKQLLTRVQKNDTNNAWITDTYKEYIALITAALFALAPWHVQISRVAYEANVALFLVLLGIWLFFKSISAEKNKTLLFTLAGISFVLTIYTFNSNRVFTPLLIIALALMYAKELFAKKSTNIKPVLIASLIAILMAIPALQHMLSKEGQLRYKEVNIFTDSQVIQQSNDRIKWANDSLTAKIFNNRRVLFTQKWLDGYFQHFSGKFLFISGDNNPRFSLQDVGGLQIILIPFLFIGGYLMLSRPNKEFTAVLVWMMLAPIPAAFAREVPHALRSLNILPTFQIIAALGFLFAMYKIKNSQWKIKKPALWAMIAFSALSITAELYYFQHNYYAHYPQYAQSEWQYGYKQMVQKLSEIDKNYDRVVITDGLGRPYSNVLFYKQYPPAQFQKERMAKTDDTAFGFITVYQFNKYQFRGLNWKKEIAQQKDSEKVLLVGVPGEIPENKFTIAKINDLKGNPVFIFNELPKGQDALLELK